MTVNEAILVFIFVVIGAALFAAGGVFLIAVMRSARRLPSVASAVFAER
jgi:hypothetical protein